MAIRIGLVGARPAPQTVEALFHEHGNRVFKLAYHLTGSQTDAEDVTQEVFLKLFRGGARMAECRNLRAWLYRVVTNACFDLLRARQARQRRERPADEGAIENAIGPDGPARPDRQMDRAELSEKLSEAIRMLPPQQAAALLLFDHEGLKAREVAAIMSVSEASVRGYAWEARRRLKELLTPYLTGRTA